MSGAVIHVRNTAAAVVLGLVVTSGCAGRGAVPPCGGETALAEAVLRHQFSHNQSGLGPRAAAYFIAWENDTDPPPELLARFDGHAPPVRPYSRAMMAGSAVRDPDSGERALVFRIRGIEWPSPQRALIDTGYYEAELSAAWLRLEGRCADGAWRIAAGGPVKIS